MQNKQILSALIGLTGAVWNNGKTDHTDQLVMEVLLSPDNAEMIKKIHTEKYKISPNCETCQAPCGNTSDYDMTKFDSLTPEMLTVKERTYAVIREKVKSLREQGKTELPHVIYKAISYLGYDLEQSSYEEVMEEIKNGQADRED